MSTTVVHTRTVAAPPEQVYQLVADVRWWPVVFAPSLHVRHLEQGDGTERFQLWATVNGAVRTWVSRRELDPAGLRISFRQEHSRPPITSMEGDWSFTALPGGKTEVALTHTFSTVDDDRELDGVTTALDRNSDQELTALARIAESGHPAERLLLSFEDQIVVTGSTAAAYDFIARADRWPDRLPHVSRVTLREEPDGVQDLEMETVTADGAAHTTRSTRLCFPPDVIIYKQTLLPRLLWGHAGAWEFHAGPDSGLVTARHTVAVDPSAVTEVLGAGATLDDARRHLRDVLGANSRATLSHANRAAVQR